MAQPTVEVCSFIASQKLLDDERLIFPVYDIVIPREGLHHLYEGIGVKDHTKRWIFIDWETYEHHQQLINAPIYGELGQKLGECIGADFKMQHVVFADTTIVSLTAPVTSIATFTLKDAAKRDLFLQNLEEILRSTNSKYQPFTFGQSREDPNVYIFVVGWENVESDTSSFEKLQPFAEIEVEHAKIREYGMPRQY